MLGEALTAVNMEKNGILGCCMTFSLRGAVPALAVLLLAAGCIENVPRYIVIPAKGQSDQQMNNDQFDCNLQAQKQTGYNPDKALTEGAIAGLLIGGAAGAGASIVAIAGGGTGAQLVGPYLHDKNLNETQRAYYACLETRGYTLTR